MRLLIRRLADQGMTVLLSSHLLTEVEEVCNRVAIVRSGSIVYEGEIADLKRGAGTSYRLETTDDDRAIAVCRAQRGHQRRSRASVTGIVFTADEAAVAELSQALVEAGALIRALAPQTVTLEDLFFSLTEGDGARADEAEHPNPAITPRRGGRAVSAIAASSGAPGVGTVFRWELTKLRHQKRTYLGLGAAAIVPILFVLAIHFRHDRRGGDFAFAYYLTRSGLAMPLVLMLFGAVWMFPLITALVAGDIFASEDHNGTLKTIFTRSLDRGQIFAGKALAAAAYAIVAILLSGTVAVVAGSIQSGFNSLQSLSGTIVSAPKGLELVYASLLVYLMQGAAAGQLVGQQDRSAADRHDRKRLRAVRIRSTASAISSAIRSRAACTSAGSRWATSEGSPISARPAATAMSVAVRVGRRTRAPLGQPVADRVGPHSWSR